VVRSAARGPTNTIQRHLQRMESRAAADAGGPRKYGFWLVYEKLNEHGDDCTNVDFSFALSRAPANADW